MAGDIEVAVIKKQLQVAHYLRDCCNMQTAAEYMRHHGWNINSARCWLLRR